MGIETQLRDEFTVMAAGLAEKFSEQFAAAGKFVDIEELSEQIGDELTRQLASQELAKRSAESARRSEHECPTCGRTCRVETDPEPVILEGTRGTIEYTEPRCHCQKCRRDFFPAGR